jgi:hypothetical protein
MIKYLDIRATLVQSLEGMPRLHNIQAFIADNSQISTLKNFRSIETASKISLVNTPVSREPTYRLSAVILLGHSIRALDDFVVSNALKRKALSYPSYASSLIDQGWLAEFPLPDAARWTELCSEYGVEMAADDISNSGESSFEEPELIEDEEDDFELLIYKLRSRQEAMFAEAAKEFGIVAEVNVEAELGRAISSLFAKHGVEVDPSNEDDLVKAVEDVCLRAVSGGAIADSTFVE